MSHAQSAVGRASRSAGHVRTQLPCSKRGNVFLTAVMVSMVKKASAMVKLWQVAIMGVAGFSFGKKIGPI